MDVADQVAKKALSREELEYSAILGTLAGELSTYFLSITEDSLDSLIINALSKIGTTCNLGRVNIFLLSDDLKTVSNRYEWVAEGVTSQKDKVQNIPVTMLKWLEETIYRDKVLNVTSVDDLPEEAKTVRDLMVDQGIKSLLSTIIYSVNEKYIGFIGYNAVDDIREWSSIDMDYIRLFGRIIGSALEKDSYERALLERNRELEKMLKSIINRELKMVELKEELERVRKNL